MKLVVLAVLLLAACTPAPVVPANPPDASDASPAPALDAGSACASACANLAALCGVQPPSCLDSMTKIDTKREIRSPSGAPATCACVAAATSLAALTACGVNCGP